MSKNGKLRELLNLDDKLGMLERIQDEKKLNKRMYIVDTDPYAPICIRCRYCQQRGFIFECAIYENVGLYGIVYYKRRNHKPKTYANVPLKDDRCRTFKEMKPLTEEELEAIEHR